MAKARKDNAAQTQPAAHAWVRNAGEQERPAALEVGGAAPA